MLPTRLQLRPLQGCARSVQFGRANIAQRCSSPRSLRFSSQLNKPDTILAKQRLNRPVSPHLSIYRTQITWIVSIATRITGISLSGGLYLYAAGYLSSPVTGWDIGSESLVSAFGSLPPVAKFTLKFSVALPFTFHSFNGIRHLVWDTGRGMANTQVARSGWTVVGASTVVAVLLALWKPDGDDV